MNRWAGRNAFRKVQFGMLGMLVCASALGVPRATQDPDFPEVAFQEWLEQGPREELRWK